MWGKRKAAGRWVIHRAVSSGGQEAPHARLQVHSVQRTQKNQLERPKESSPELSLANPPRASPLPAQLGQPSASVGQPALTTIGPIKCPFKNDFCQCLMKINTFLHGRAVTVMNEVMRSPVSLEARCYLCMSKICFLISLMIKTLNLVIDLKLVRPDQV